MGKISQRKHLKIISITSFIKLKVIRLQRHEETFLTIETFFKEDLYGV